MVQTIPRITYERVCVSMEDLKGEVHQRGPIAARLWAGLIVLMFAVWWGGLTFYAAVVVPTGSEEIGETTQGFITQRVTQWHNAILTAMTACLIIEAWRQKRRLPWGIVCGLALVDTALMAQHVQLTAMMDFDSWNVLDGFYPKHAMYLWLTAVEWALGLSVPFAFSLARDDQVRRAS